MLLATLAATTTFVTAQDTKSTDRYSPALIQQLNTHDGKVARITSTELVMKNSKGEEHLHSLSEKTRVTLDGKECAAIELKPGTRIRVTTNAGKSSEATWIEGINDNNAFANYVQDGEIATIAGDKLVINCSKSHQTFTRTLSPEIVVTCDGKRCKTSSLTKGQIVRVTSDQNDPYTAMRIESLTDNSEFAHTHLDGKIVRIDNENIVFTIRTSEEESTLKLQKDIPVSCDGKPAKVTDLLPGMLVRISTDVEAPKIAVKIEGLKTHPGFKTNQNDGRVINVMEHQLLMANMDSGNEHTMTFMNDVEVTCDGEICQVSDIQKGMRIRVISTCQDPHAAIKIEAIDKNREFSTF